MSIQPKSIPVMKRCVMFVSYVALVFGMQSAIASNGSFNEMLVKARAGDMNAQFSVAEDYYHGDGVKRSYIDALAWYEKSATQGHVEAQHKMGYFYQHGLANLAKDNQKAFEWYHKAAEQDHTAAQTQIAIMYSRGVGVKQNKALSRQWSNRVLKKKGLLDNTNHAKPAAVEKAAAQPRTQPQPGLQQTAAPKVAAKTKPPAKPKAQRSAKEHKAWRYEQARLLRERASQNATDVGGWADEE